MQKQELVPPRTYAVSKRLVGYMTGQNLVTETFRTRTVGNDNALSPVACQLNRSNERGHTGGPKAPLTVPLALLVGWQGLCIL